MDEALEALVRLGFTDLEARAYVFLLGESPVTGYRVAQGVGRPGANVYKALESLERKGAILVDDGEVRLVRPVPVAELLDQLAAGFQRDRSVAEDALKSLGGPEQDDRIYQLSSVDQVFARARALLDSATTDVLIDAEPASMGRLRSAVDAAAARGVTVAAFLYDEIELHQDVTQVVHPDAQGVQSRWPAWVHVIADGSRALIAFLDDERGEVQQAIYTGSALLSFSLLLGSASEMAVAEMRRCFDEERSADEIKTAFEALWRRVDPGASPGFARVQSILGRSGGSS